MVSWTGAEVSKGDWCWNWEGFQCWVRTYTFSFFDSYSFWVTKGDLSFLFFPKHTVIKFVEKINLLLVGSYVFRRFFLSRLFFLTFKCKQLSAWTDYCIWSYFVCVTFKLLEARNLSTHTWFKEIFITFCKLMVRIHRHNGGYKGLWWSLPHLNLLFFFFFPLSENKR